LSLSKTLAEISLHPFKSNPSGSRAEHWSLTLLQLCEGGGQK
jgi:hypothetical protein